MQPGAVSIPATLTRTLAGPINGAMSEVLFYHLERQSLEQLLPVLIDKTLQRGWRAVVEVGDGQRIKALSSALWTWRDEAFLPHGQPGDGHEARQPVWLTDAGDNPNGAQVRFFVDGAEPHDIADLERAIIVFDGHDESAVAAAREHWKALAAAGHTVTYWKQEPGGKWVKMN